MFTQSFRNIDDILRKEAGCTTELDYTEQTSWILFLKYLDDLEQEKAIKAQLERKPYTHILDLPFRWETWAAPKGEDGLLDHNKAMTGDDLGDFVDEQLFPYLQSFKQKASGPNTIEYKIGEIFGEIKNKISSGYNLREIIDHIDELRFRSQTEKHELSALYEEKIAKMGNAGRNGGEYYTPRPLIRAMIKVINPQLGETIYDGACGSAGFLCESFDYLVTNNKLSTEDFETLQTQTFFGKEKKSLAYVIAIMNMILHGIEAPNILHTNTLTENLAAVQEKDRYDIILANPPFGGKERKEVQQNFPIRTSETAYLFLQHFIKNLKAGGRAAIVIKNTFLSNSDNASISLRKLLLETCNLHTILDCPSGTFLGPGVKTVVLFFEKGAPTRKIWYYQLDPGRNLGKTNALNDADLDNFVILQRSFALSSKSWAKNAPANDSLDFDLSVKNPNMSNEMAHRNPSEIIAEIMALDIQGEQVLAKVKELNTIFVQPNPGWETKTLLETCHFINGLWKGKKPPFVKVNVIRNTNFTKEGTMDSTDVAFLEVEKSQYEKRRLRFGDIILEKSGGGPKQPVGRVVLFDIAEGEYSLSNFTAAIRIIDKETLDFRFLHRFLHWIYLSGVTQGMQSHSTGIRNLDGNAYKSIRVPVPPMPVQRKIVQNLDNLTQYMRSLEIINQRKVELVNELKKSLLHQSFAKI